MIQSADGMIATALNALSLRQRLIANNIANIDTPGFKASDVDFEAQLRSAIRTRLDQGGSGLTRTRPRHLDVNGGVGASLDPRVVADNGGSMRVDRNNVDIDQQMIKLSESAITYSALAQLAASRYSLLESIVTDGRR